MADLLELWKSNPRAMWDWRVETFRRLLVIVEKLALNPPEMARTADQLKAVEQLQKLMGYIDEVHEDLPTACPKCKHTFLPGK